MKQIDEHSITNAQIKALREEAITAGDLEQVDICDLALQSRNNGMAEAGDTKHLRICARVINEAAQD